MLLILSMLSTVHESLVRYQRGLKVHFEFCEYEYNDKKLRRRGLSSIETAHQKTASNVKT